MYAFSLILVIILGLVFGSFLNVCITRLPRHESIVRPRSRCPRCGANIAARDNVPVLSYVLIGGRCRRCRKPISLRYPAIEIALAALWTLCWLYFGPDTEALGMAVLVFILLGLAAMDAETLRLPNAFTLPGIVLGIIYSGVRGWDHWMRAAVLSLSWAISAAGILLAFSAIYWLVRRREGLGIGDAKLMALITAWLGPNMGALTLFLGIVATAIFGVALSAQRRKLDGSVPLPLGSFLCAAALFVTFYGQDALRWYFGFFRA